VIEIEAWDGSRVRQLSEITLEQTRVITLVWAGVSQPVASTPPVSEVLWLERFLTPTASVLGGPPLSLGCCA
jgi:hypothetical protein